MWGKLHFNASCCQELSAGQRISLFNIGHPQGLESFVLITSDILFWAKNTAFRNLVADHELLFPAKNKEARKLGPKDVHNFPHFHNAHHGSQTRSFVTITASTVL